MCDVETEFLRTKKMNFVLQRKHKQAQPGNFSVVKLLLSPLPLHVISVVSLNTYPASPSLFPPMLLRLRLFFKSSMCMLYRGVKTVCHYIPMS